MHVELLHGLIFSQRYFHILVNKNKIIKKKNSKTSIIKYVNCKLIIANELRKKREEEKNTGFV